MSNADTKYKDAAWLREQYRDRERTKSDIAAECGVSRETIRRWINRHDIPLRGKDSERTEYKTIGLPAPDWKRHRDRKDRLGLTWVEYLDAEGADPLGPEAIAEAVAEHVDGVDAETVREAAFEGAREAVGGDE